MAFKFPWSRRVSNDRLVVSWSGQTLAYVLARQTTEGLHEVLQLGVAHQGSESLTDFFHQLQGLGLKGLDAHIMLWPEQYQMLQIDAPAVPPEELRLAARYQIREMLDSHVDEVTLDVMRVGDGQQQGVGYLFVVAATNAVVRGILDLSDALHWTVPVIDIQETAQRNLQNALAARDGYAHRAHAALVLQEGHQAVLTICANDELFYTRRFELPARFLAAPWEHGPELHVNQPDTFTPVGEYVPDYTYALPVSLLATATVSEDDAKAQHFVLEVQRSLDVWSRSWSSMPLFNLRVYAGERTDELAKWLAVQLGQTVLPLDVAAMFPGFEAASLCDQSQCLPLLGVLLRTEVRKL